MTHAPGEEAWSEWASWAGDAGFNPEAVRVKRPLLRGLECGRETWGEVRSEPVGNFGRGADRIARQREKRRE